MMDTEMNCRCGDSGSYRQIEAGKLITTCGKEGCLKDNMAAVVTTVKPYPERIAELEAENAELKERIGQLKGLAAIAPLIHFDLTEVKAQAIEEAAEYLFANKFILDKNAIEHMTIYAQQVREGK